TREFGGDRLAHDHRAGGAHQRDDGRVARRRTPGVQRRAVLGRHVRGVDDVLDADRHAVQRSDRLSRQSMLVGGARLRQRVVGIEKRPRLDTGVGFTDARQTRSDVLLGRDHAVADQPRGVGGGEGVKVAQVHGPDTSMLRSRGPSNSSSTMRWNWPRRILPSRTGTDTDGPTSALSAWARTWSATSWT